MTHARRVIVSVLGAMLLAAPLVRAQEVKANEAKVIVMHPLPIAPRGGAALARPRRVAACGLCFHAFYGRT